MNVDLLRWGLALKGHEADLQEWRRAFGSASDPFVEECEHGLVLWSRRLQNTSSALEAWEHSSSLLRQMNSVMLHAVKCRPVERESIVERAANGRLLRHAVLEAQGLEIRAVVGMAELKVYDKEGNLIPPPPPIPSKEQLWLRSAAGNEKLAELLAYAYDQTSWFETYKSIEVLENVLGGEGKLVEFAAEDGAKVKPLKRTANQLHRHPAGTFAPPNVVMTLDEANLLVSRLVWKLLNREAGVED